MVSECGFESQPGGLCNLKSCMTMSFKWMESERAKETSWSQCGMKFLDVSECGFESHPGQSVCVFSSFSFSFIRLYTGIKI